MALIQIEIEEAKNVFIMAVCIIFEPLKGLILNCDAKNCVEKLLKFPFSIKTLNIGMT
jgi:hypothetical protein